MRRTRWRILVDRSIEAMKEAISVRNQASALYRTETFVTLSVIAWELLLKAKMLKDSANKLSVLWVKQSGANKRRVIYKKTRSKTKVTKGISQIINELSAANLLPKPVQRNLEAMIEIRNHAVHFYVSRRLLEGDAYQVFVACVNNYILACREWFGVEVMLPLPIAVGTPEAGPGLRITTAEKRLLQFLSGTERDLSQGDEAYRYKANIEVRLVSSQSSAAAPVKIVRNGNAVPVQLTDDEFFQRYPLSYRELVQKCRDRYEDFKENRRWHQIKRTEIDGNPKLVHERRLDPKNPKSGKKSFYSRNVFNILDKHYKKRQ